MAMRRVHAALARYEQTSTKHGMRDTKDSWASKHEFDLAAWHAAQASLWDMMGKFTIASALRPGCDSLASVHEELALDQVASDSDARLTVMFAKAERVCVEYEKELTRRRQGTPVSIRLLQSSWIIRRLMDLHCRSTTDGRERSGRFWNGRRS